MPRKGAPFGKRQALRWQYQYTTENRTESDKDTSMDVDVGGNLRRLREERTLSIRALAESSGLAINTLSLIENGKSSPSVSTLQQLANALVVPITAFFETEAPKRKVAYVKAGQRPRAMFEQGILEDLGADSVVERVEPFVVILEPNAGSGAQEIVHTGFEFIYCLEGRLLYTIEGQNYLLEPGDSILFEAHYPHRWQNLGPGISRSILVLYPTDERDYPSQRHFSGD